MMSKMITRVHTDASLTRTLAFCDFETVLVNNVHSVVSYAIAVDTYVDFKIIDKCDVGDIHAKSSDLIEAFLDSCVFITKQFKHVTFYFHNLSKFDSYFIINHCSLYAKYVIDILVRHRLVYKIDIKYNNVTLSFRDSLLMIPVSLEKLSMSFNKQFFKSNIDHNKSFMSYLSDDAFRSELIAYCINDVKCLQEAYTTFRGIIFDKFNIDCVKSLSLPSLSMKIFRSKYYHIDIENTIGNKECFIRRSYFGGSVDVYKPKLDKGYHYDINSLYPYVMKSCDYPIGEGVWVDKENIDLSTFFGFVEVDVHCPEGIYIPLLSYYDKNKGLITPVGRFHGVYFSEEIKMCMSLGYTFTVIKGIKYDKGVVFNDIIDTLYTMRFNSGKGSPLNEICKLLMNSLYGRFGMKQDNTLTQIVTQDKLNDILAIHTISDIKELNDKFIVVYNPKSICYENLIDYKQIKDASYINSLLNNIENTPRYKGVSAVQIASAITSYARMKIYVYKTINTNVYYSDTDSIFTSSELPSHLVSENKLGYMKLVEHVHNCIFISPKLYYTEVNNKPIIKSKGVTKGCSDIHMFEKLYNDTSVSTSVLSLFKRNFDVFSIYSGVRNITLTGKFNKRDKVYNNGRWVDTKPLLVNYRRIHTIRDLINITLDKQSRNNKALHEIINDDSISTLSKDDKISKMRYKTIKSCDMFYINVKDCNELNNIIKLNVSKLSSRVRSKYWLITYHSDIDLGTAIISILATLYKTVGGFISVGKTKFSAQVVSYLHKYLIAVNINTLNEDITHEKTMDLKTIYILGDLIIESLMELGYVKSENKEVTLTELGLKRIGEVIVYDYNFPSLSLPVSYSHDHSPIIMNDSTNIRNDKTVKCHKDVYDVVNYLQSIPFTIDEKKFNSYCDNLSDNFIDYCGDTYNENILLTIDELHEKYKILSRKSLNLIVNDWMMLRGKLDLFCMTVSHCRLLIGKRFYIKIKIDWRGRLYMMSHPVNLQSFKHCRNFIKFDFDDVVGVDVKASGFQIIGLLSADTKTLECTNVFECLNKEDFYELNLKLFKDLCASKGVDAQLINCFDRSFYKQKAMCRIYSEGDYTRTDDIKEFLFKTLHRIIDISICREISKLLNLSLVSNNARLFEIEDLIRKVSTKVIKNKEIIKINTSNFHIQTVAIYPCQETKHITIQTVKGVAKRCVNVDMIPFKQNTRKILNSIVPNVIHQLDSYMAHQVVKKCMEKGIKIYTVHDCFYVEKKHVQDVKKFYYDSCYNTFCVENPLHTFIHVNRLENEFSKEIEMINSHRHTLSKLFNTREMCNQILS